MQLAGRSRVDRVVIINLLPAIAGWFIAGWMIVDWLNADVTTLKT